MKSEKEKGKCKEESSNLELHSSKNELEENIKLDEFQDINNEVSITKISETQEFTYNPITWNYRRDCLLIYLFKMKIYQKHFQKEVTSW